ncbi:MAG: hypothetical protein RLN89_09220 [Parvibaculum sp.]
MAILKRLYPWGPVFFGIGFLAPLFAALMEAFGIAAPLGLSEIQTGLLIGTGWGLVAKFGGRWI